MIPLLGKLSVLLGALSVALAATPANQITITPPPQEQLGVLGLIYQNFNKPELALKIADCESKLKNVPNYLYTGEDGKYTAYGIFQIEKKTFDHFSCEGDRRNIKDNILCAAKIFKRGELWRWNESRSCWNSPLNAQN